MNFSTPVELPSDLPRFTQADELLLMGSCFATNIGVLLADARFRPDVNPFGVLYNPLSVSTALRELVTGRLYKEEDLFFFRECWHSSMHHGDFLLPLQKKCCSVLISVCKQRTNVSTIELPDVDFWYSMGVRTEIHGTCGC